MTRSFTPAGYVPCACRDCFETAIGTPGALCHECEATGCAPDRACQAAEAYGGEAELDPSEALTVPPPAETLRAMCAQQGFLIVCDDVHAPRLVLARMLAVLRVLDADAHARVTGPKSQLVKVPREALDRDDHPHWDSHASDDALSEIMVALDRAAPAGFLFGAEGAVQSLRLGFFRVS